MGRSTGRSTPFVEACSGQEWHFHISTFRAHIGIFTFLLLELMLADQLADVHPW